MTKTNNPVALTIAGSDPSGGAGIQADLKTFTALGVYGASVITALTAQNTHGVTGVHGVPDAFIIAQFEAVASDLDIAAIKTGMLATSATVKTVAGCLSKLPSCPVVVDPVMVATSGDSLLEPDAVAAVREFLIPRATLITPNLHEAARLLGESLAADEAGQCAQAERLLKFGAAAVLLKGGHGASPDAVDVLATGNGLRLFKLPRIETRHTHGTGCTLSAAIAAYLAIGEPLEQAVQAGKHFVWQALQSATTYGVGSGTGPVDHVFATRESGRKERDPQG